MTSRPDDAVTMDEITRRLEVLNESLRIFIEAWNTRTCAAEREAFHARINELCQVIVKLGGTVTAEVPR